MTRYIASNFKDNASLVIDKLQQKTVLLLYIATMRRPRSDIVTLQICDVHFQFDNHANLTGVTLFIRPPRKAQQEYSALDTLLQMSMCPVHTMFMGKKKDIYGQRSQLEHIVFPRLCQQFSKHCLAPQALSSFDL